VGHNVLVGFDLNRNSIARTSQSTDEDFAFGEGNVVDIHDPAYNFATPSRSELD
jgi:hypothetical protein